MTSAGEAASESTPASKQTYAPIDVSEGESWYEIKWITWKSKRLPILVQNKNGPCPLIALCNVLFLRCAFNINSTMEIISSEALLQLLVNQMLESTPKSLPEGESLNYQQNVQDTMSILPKLQTGLDLNVKFNRANGYEFTDAVGIFDLLQVNLYHGWLVDPENPTHLHAVGELAYNQLVDMIIAGKGSEDPDRATTAVAAEDFLRDSANQLTFHGLIQLHRTVREGEFCVFFRNNHFSTVYRHEDKLYLLVTDYGFLNESNFVWEALDSVDGDSQFFDAKFSLASTSATQVSALKVSHGSPDLEPEKDNQTASPLPNPQTERGVDADFGEKHNAELAEKLVREAQMMEDEALAWKMMAEDEPPLIPPSNPAPVILELTGTGEDNSSAAPVHRSSGAGGGGGGEWDERISRQSQEQVRLMSQRTRASLEREDANCSIL